MINRAIAGLFAAIVAALLFAAPALADIRTFNELVKAGDYKQAAIEAKAIWATWDRQSADTALIAREFGYISYVAGDYAAARDFGQFLKEEGRTLTTPDNQPVISAVLLGVANLRLKPDEKARAELLNALKQRRELPDVEGISVLAVEALYSGDWKSGNYRNTVESAELAAALLGRGGKALTVRTLQARSFGAISEFMAGREPRDYILIADVHDATVDALDASTNVAERQQLMDLKFTMQAWAYSLSAYFDSLQQTGSNIPKRVRDRELKRPAHEFFPENTPSELLCKTELDKGRIRYPSSAAFRGLIGTVIVKIDVDHEGRITNPEVLASVPSEGFADEILKSIHTARFKRANDAEPGCLLLAPSRVFSFVFRIS